MEITKREGTGESEREREQGLGEQNLLKCSVVKQKQPPPPPQRRRRNDISMHRRS